MYTMGCRVDGNNDKSKTARYIKHLILHVFDVGTCPAQLAHLTVQFSQPFSGRRRGGGKMTRVLERLSLDFF